MKKIPEIFTSDFKHWFKIEVFRRVIYLFLLINTISLLPIASDLWAYDGMSGTRWNAALPIWKQGSTALINVLSHPANATYTWIYVLFIFGQLFFLVTGILRIIPKISAIAVYFFTVNLFLKGALFFTGGEVLLNLILFYLMFIQQSENSRKWNLSLRIKRDEKIGFSEIQNVLNHVFYALILIQVCVLYFFSTLYKLLDANWISGDALTFIARIPAYSGGLLRFLFSENHTLSAIASYAVLIYGGVFSILVWIKRIKIPFLLFGVLLHLGIAFGMGIFTFGIVMCLMYIPFLSADQVDTLLQKLRIRKG